ncbi:DNA/RNA helicase SEN1 KNAG_0B06440 [Huiozyma naganishii CBS 8797]|uniref:UvrD-like helicase ATP-binding domain-containing protein n=1 Tax=Huiozyma naganishii (strain ATCC MYA-139 / BCRC 22969 / CBS 8797 / KCTC 17520 / NBRC 10181 / NCYC 3082 / Yp74L-3) TaxID=1071383 RepID=J7RVU8_HUIN7|nr:hypothetical protein KNAG_0B06440 [Kazachstania naganishii CBS 8797]CCK69072.1 hypothetical protein KNAG_0B06440 [Kazachstania naganishii CBS 8797]
MTDVSALSGDLLEKANSYIPLIEEVYKGTNPSIVEAELLGDLLRLLAEVPLDFHLFCDPVLKHISIFCLTIFSFSEQNTVDWLKNRFDPILTQCDKCVLNFIRGKCKMLEHFAIQRHVPHEHVSRFNDIVCIWRIKAVSPTLRNIEVVNNSSVLITKEIEMGIFESLCNPHMLRLNKEFKACFDALFKYFYDEKNEFLNVTNPKSLNTFLAGVIYCWCEGSDEEIKWAGSFLKKLHKEKFTFTGKTLPPDILQEVYFHLLFLENPSNWNETVISQFWTRFFPILSLFDMSVFNEHFVTPKNIESLKQSIRYPIVSIFILWYNHLSKNYNDKPLDILLKVMRMFLEKMGPVFWQEIEPYTFHSILDNIFEKSTFATKLIKTQNEPLPHNDLDKLFTKGNIDDLLSWNLPFYHSLSTSKRIQMVKKVSIAFLRIIANFPDLKPLPKACLMNSSTALLSAVLTIKEEERSQLYYNEDFQTVLFTKTDSRTLMNNPMVQSMVIKSATNPSEVYPGLGNSATSIARSAMLVLTKCIDFDILLLCQRTYKLYMGKAISDYPLPLTLLENVVTKVDLRSFHDGPLLAKELLISLRNINGLLPVNIKSATVEKHNNTVITFIYFSTKLIEKFADILPQQMSTILCDKEASQGFWSCVFSSDSQLYQEATNMLYDTFDVEGRFEGIQALLHKSLNNQLDAINIVLSQLIKCEFYEPCPRAVRVLMDVISVFSDPVTGLISNYSTLKDESSDRTVAKFWSLIWSFLDTIYRCTLKWAAKYDYSELEKFTKDTLELTNSLVGSYREISDILHGSGFDLFKNIRKAFKNMLYWLRLSDEELLDSCVKLIISTVDLACEKNIKFDDEIIDAMVRYASKAKTYSNKLSDSQTSEILSKARLCDSALTDRVVKETEAYHKAKQMAKLQATESKKKQSDALENKADFLHRKATSSSLMSRPKSSQPKITAFGSMQPGEYVSLKTTKAAKPMSRMEQARRQLLNNRIVHPPSTSVFNSKPSVHPTERRNSSSDESEDDGDIETARELFASTKNKGKGIGILDINGQTIKKDTSAEQKRREEENMRRRLNVEINSLYDVILQWDYNRSDEYPTDKRGDSYADVKDAFRSVEEYRSIMKPLLLLECWQGLCSARDREDNRPFSIIVGNRTAVSDFYEVYASVSKQMIQDSSVSESDLIVLAYLPDVRTGEKLSSENFKRAQNTCLAKVRTIKHTKGNAVDLTLRIHRNHHFSKFLVLRSEIHAVKVMQMTTVEREYQTLEGLEYYDLVDQILLAKPPPAYSLSPEEIEVVKNNYKLNKSQAEAIVNTVIKDGFSLIQGPPGTGKTKTILGIIGYFLSTRRTAPSNVIKIPGEKATLSLEQQLKKQKILICAPSNAAVDEICLRLKSGVYDAHGKLFQPNLVRIGRSDVVNVAIKDLTLEELVERRLSQNSYEFTQNSELDRKFNNAVTKRRQLRDQLNAEDGSPVSKLSSEDITKLQLEIRELSKEINELGKQRDEIREKNSVNYRSRDLHRRNAQVQILANSNIICSTLSGSAHDVLATLGITFDTVIIDEACQCTELSAIIPLRYGGKRCIMVGDPNQLPPTVLSGAASNFKYNQSLFVRMEKNSQPYLLNVQYRMHPDISSFPSKEFYDGKLTDGPGMEEINKRPWHSCPPLSPYKFFDIAMGRQEQNLKSMSFTNAEEVRAALKLIDHLFKKFDNTVNFTGKIGIISPYREQMLRMRREFTRQFGGSITKYIDFNTIDGFQGQEKEIIIISCVRADDTKSSVGFLKDFRRMNVAFTRAKTSMWILGHQRSLVKNKLWRNLIEDARNRNMIEMIGPNFLFENPTNKTVVQSALRRFSAEETDSYDPMEVKETTRKRKLQSDAKPDVVTQKKEKGPEGEQSLEQKSKKLKKSKKEKRESSKTAKKSDTLNTATGTKKKSSIFGAPSLSDSLPKNLYINDEASKEKKKRERKAVKHITFSETPTSIPNVEEYKSLIPSKDLPKPTSSIYKSMKEDQETKRNLVTDHAPTKDNDDYIPTIGPSSIERANPAIRDVKKSSGTVGKTTKPTHESDNNVPNTAKPKTIPKTTDKDLASFSNENIITLPDNDEYIPKPAVVVQTDKKTNHQQSSENTEPLVTLTDHNSAPPSTLAAAAFKIQLGPQTVSLPTGPKQPHPQRNPAMGKPPGRRGPKANSSSMFIPKRKRPF